MKSSRAESLKSENQIDCATQTTTSKTIHIVIVRTKSRPKNRPYAGMQNTEIGLAPLVICPICPVTDGTEPKRPSPVKRGRAGLHFKPICAGFSRPGRVLGQTICPHR